MHPTNFNNSSKENSGNNCFKEMDGAILLFQLVHVSVDKYFLG